MFGDYYEVRTWLEEYIPFVYGKEELGLGRIEELLRLLGNPQEKFKSIHIAGTSGKGSTAFYVAKLLSSQLTVNGSRLKVGLHISPHLVDIRERMQIFSSPVIPAKAGINYRKKILDRVENDNPLVSMGDFLKLFSEIKPIVEGIKKENPDLTPSYFEILVAASFLYFAQEKVDWAVVEVGLGGRLDATNVLQSRIAVITNIGLDHTEILGKTVEKIAYEKAGIIKSARVQKGKSTKVGIPVVTGASGKALGVIEKVAKSKGSKLVKVTTQKGPFGNQLLAKIALETLGITVSEASMKKALDVGFAGRFEEIAPNVVLDGAHNPDKIKALILWIKSFQLLTVNSQLILVLAFKKGKRWKKMVDLLVGSLPVSQVIATEFSAVTDTGPTPSCNAELRGVKNFAAVPAEEIAKYIKSKSKVFFRMKTSQVKSIKNSQEAVFEAINSIRHSGERSDSRIKQSRFWTSQNDLVVVTGSLYLIGEVRTMWELPDF